MAISASNGEKLFFRKRELRFTALSELELETNVVTGQQSVQPSGQGLSPASENHALDARKRKRQRGERGNKRRSRV